MATYKDSVTIPPFPSISLPKDTTVCANTVLTVTAIPIGGTKPYTIWWGKHSRNIYGTAITQTISKDTTFTVFLSDAYGCLDYNSMRVKTIPSPNAQWTIDYRGNACYFHAIDSSLADSSYHWIFGDGNSATGHSTKHIFASVAKYDIGLTVNNSNGCSSQYDSTVSIDRSGYEPTKNDSVSLTLYPNPFQSTATIQYKLGEKTNVQIYLYDITGREIACLAHKIVEPGTFQTVISAEKYHLGPGVYLLKFITDDKFMTRDIVKL